jgi:hypothetical protein
MTVYLDGCTPLAPALSSICQAGRTCTLHLSHLFATSSPNALQSSTHAHLHPTPCSPAARAVLTCGSPRARSTTRLSTTTSLAAVLRLLSSSAEAAPSGLRTTVANASQDRLPVVCGGVVVGWTIEQCSKCGQAISPGWRRAKCLTHHIGGSPWGIFMVHGSHNSSNITPWYRPGTAPLLADAGWHGAVNKGKQPAAAMGVHRSHTTTSLGLGQEAMTHP